MATPANSLNRRLSTFVGSNARAGSCYAIKAMSGQNSSSSESDSRVVNFPHGRPAARPAGTPPNPFETLGKYEGGREEPSDYRHRMLVNAAAFIFVVALIGAGLWLADTMAAMRKNQDCVLSGRRGCTPVEVNRDRW